MHLHIHSIEKTIYDGNADVISLPAESGIISVLPGHTPLVTALKAGTIDIKTSSGSESFKIKSGFAQINGESVIILAE